MKFLMRVPTLLDVEYLRISIDVCDESSRTTVNGKKDIDGTLVPLRKGSIWCPTIRLKDGLVMNWPKETMAIIDYDYWFKSAELLDPNSTVVAKLTEGFSYIPSFVHRAVEGGLVRGGVINSDGFIQGWKWGIHFLDYMDWRVPNPDPNLDRYYRDPVYREQM